MSRIVPPIPITLDTERALKSNFNALALIKEWTGLNAFKGDNLFKAEVFTHEAKRAIAVDPCCLRAVLAAMLFEDDETMTPVKAGRLIHAENYADVLAKCVEAVNSFFPDVEKKTEAAKGSPLEKSVSISPTTGPSDATTSVSQSASSGV